MSIHEGFQELAAASIDFELDDYDRAELDRHLATCDVCRRAVDGFRADAADLAYGIGPRLDPARSQAILARALRPSARQSPSRLLVIAALFAVLGAGLVAAALELTRRTEGPIALVPSGSPSVSPGSSTGPTDPAPSAGSPSAPSGGTPQPPGSPESGAIPVRASGQEIGTLIKLAPGADRDLYVLIPAGGGTLLVRLDEAGNVADGWPVSIPGAGPCGLLLPVADGSVRLVCYADDLVSEVGEPNVRGFGFDADGRGLAGWPVDLPCCFTGRMIGDELTVFTQNVFGDPSAEGVLAGASWLVTAAADGTVTTGTEVPFARECCLDTWAIGPNGVAYGTTHVFSDVAATSELLAVGPTGAPAGFPIAIDGNVSAPVFDAAGRIYLTVGSPVTSPVRTLVFGPDGKVVDAGSDQLDLAATNEWWGAGGDFPGSPLVAGDGTAFVIGTDDGTTVMGLSPFGEAMAGWPYSSSVGMQDTGFCGPGDTGCGGFRAAPAIGPDNILFLIHAAAESTAGGSIVAIGQDGEPLPGWPVGLRRPGSEFWSVATAADGTAYVLAVEPEPNGSHSATILSIAPGSDVLYIKTIVEP
jgi:hypothetical protein